ncbi:MAG TPA: CHAD domain-containing protein [Bryobacteraceae bacterium]|nr:CHAD domain-containing protein [Bryobacteraceae bacterium]
MKRAEKALEQFAETQTRQRLKTLSQNLRKAARHPDDPDSIHDLRVSIRRFRQSLRVFRDLFGESHVKKMKRSLREIMQLCGAVRNCDIAMDVLKAAGVPASPRMKRELKEERSQAARRLSKRLAKVNSHGGTRQWRTWLRAEMKNDETVEANARAVLLPMTRRFFEAGEGAARAKSTPAEMHQFRLMAKRLRYSFETYGPMAGAGWQQRIHEMRGLQDRLGAINDCVATAQLLAHRRFQKAGLCESEDVLRKLLKERTEAFRADWSKRFFKKRSQWLGPGPKPTKKKRKPQ